MIPAGVVQAKSTKGATTQINFDLVFLHISIESVIYLTYEKFKNS